MWIIWLTHQSKLLYCLYPHDRVFIFSRLAMQADHTQYLSQSKYGELQQEVQRLQHQVIPELAKRIDDARQMGDLSENAEYHAAREEMAWTQSRVKELEHILQNVQLITSGGDAGSKTITIGAVIVVEINGKKREYTIVGA